jgi:thiol-disulfide isomerase/thioredoxin
MKKLCEILLVCLLLNSIMTFISCNNIGNKESLKDTTIITNKSIDKISSDTAKFEKLSDLISYYRKQMDAIEKTKTVIYNNKNIPVEEYKKATQEIEAKYLVIQSQRNSEIYNFIVNHERKAETLLGIKYLVLDWKIPIMRIDSLFNQFPHSLRNLPEGKLWGSKIEERKKTETKLVYDLSILTAPFSTVDDKKITLNDVPTKYMLLDFWASWCAPCRQENRVLVKEKEDIENGANLTIVSISTDENKGKWIKASLEDSLNYINICDFKVKESPLWKELKIETIPFNVIIDKEGRIYGINLWGENLKMFIKNLSK